jgi:glutathione S-transferase
VNWSAVRECYNRALTQPGTAIPDMKLIGSYASPFVRKTRIVLAEKRIEYEFVVDNPHDASSRVSDFNPLGKVPVLVTDDALPSTIHA